MKKLSVLFLVFAFFIAGCSEEEMVPDNAALKASSEANAKTQTLGSTGLKNLKTAGTLISGVTPQGTFVGKATITSFSYDETNGLLASGIIKGVATSLSGTETEVTQAFTGVPVALTSGSGASSEVVAAAQCQILFLDLGPIFLDVLGLQVDLSRIVLDITAVSGAGNLLGNLLCAVVGLLDGGLSPLLGSLLGLITNLNQLLELLNQINDLLG